MTREEVNDLALSKVDSTKYIILELITGFGKTKIAIDLANKYCKKSYENWESPTTVLILVNKTVHKNEWIKEIEKWGGIYSDNITIECYNSLYKYKNSYFDIVICDEMHHLSPNRLEIFKTLNIEEGFIGLSATIKQDLKEFFINNYHAEIISCGLKKAVESNVLPEPTVYVLPLKLDNCKRKFKIKKFKQERYTTQQGYYNDMSSLIEWFKRKYYDTDNQKIKRLWLSKAGDRLKWLSEQKENIVLDMLYCFKNYKTLTFCSSIAQSERLGKHDITSKNKKALEYLNAFNANRIKHITACNILNEGVNLNNCRIGIFTNLNSSKVIVKQRIGRLLRHEKPIIIVPYFKNTREEELVKEMLQEYSEDSIKIIHALNEIKMT